MLLRLDSNQPRSLKEVTNSNRTDDFDHLSQITRDTTHFDWKGITFGNSDKSHGYCIFLAVIIFEAHECN